MRKAFGGLAFLQIAKKKKRKKKKIQFEHYHPTLVSLQIAFSGTVMALKEGDVHNILQYGAARRIGSIYSSAKSFCKIAYPNRLDPLTLSEGQRVSDDLLLLYVHIIGVFDAFGIALHRISKIEKLSSERNADLLKESFRKKVNFTSLEKLFNENDGWFHRIKDTLRNRYVHRVPPYVSHAVYTKVDRREYSKLQDSINQAIQNTEIEKAEKYMEEQRKLGKFSPYLSFVDSDEHMVLSPTVLDDVFRFQVISLRILEEMVPHLKFNEQLSQT